MPPPPGLQKKKKKGPAPAHQNSFAFVHNAKSKKTAKILSSPNVHVCRRCHDKIEWRKKYRKYKPRTQPGRCNECGQRNVTAAYHTICDKCSLYSKKAEQIRITWRQASTTTEVPINATLESQLPTLAATQVPDDSSNGLAATSTTIEETPPNERSIAESASDDADNVPVDSSSASTNGLVQTPPTAATSRFRVCAMCVQEPALPADDDDDDDRHDHDMASSRETRRLKLRELKTLERQAERQELERKRAAREARRQAKEQQQQQQQNANNQEQNGLDQSDDEENNSVDSQEQDDDFENSDSLDEANDPFLKAVGGADKLLTGEAYQQRLLELEQAMQKRSVGQE